jgi:hypothetical protein
LTNALSDAGWGELILKIEYLTAKQRNVAIKVDPKYSITLMPKWGSLSIAQTEMVKNSSVLNAGIANALISVLQKPLEIELCKCYVGTPRNLVIFTSTPKR